MARVIDLEYRADSASVRTANRDLSQFQREADNAFRSSDRLQRGLQAFGSAKLAIAGVTAALGGLVAGMATLAELNKQAIADYDKLGKTAAKLGVPPSFLQEMRVMADSAGVTSRTFDTAMQRFVRKLGDAQRGAKESAKVFADLGIAVETADGRARSAGDAFNEFMQRLRETEDHTLRLSRAVKLFDSEGAAMVNLLNTTGDELQEMIRHAERYGAAVDNNLIAKAEAYQNEIGLVQQGTQNLRTATLMMLDDMGLSWDKLKNKAWQYASAVAQALSGQDNPTLQLAQLREQIEGLDARAKKFDAQIDDPNRPMGSKLLLTERQIKIYAERNKLMREADELRKKMQGDEYVNPLSSSGPLPIPPSSDLEGDTPMEPTGRGSGGGSGGGRVQRQVSGYRQLMSMEQQLAQLKANNIQDEQQRTIALLQVRIDAANQTLETFQGTEEEKRVAAEVTQQIIAQYELDTADRLKEIGRATEEVADEAAKGLSVIQESGAAAFQGLQSAFSQFIQTGQVDFAAFVQSVLADLARIQAMKAFSMIGGSMAGAGGPWGAIGAALGGSVATHAKGDVFTTPQRFGGNHLMAEAGAEAVMPLKRLQNGNLGVVAEGGGGNVSVTNNINVSYSGSAQDNPELARQLSTAIDAKIMQAFRQQNYMRGKGYGR